MRALTNCIILVAIVVIAQFEGRPAFTRTRIDVIPPTQPPIRVIEPPAYTDGVETRASVRATLDGMILDVRCEHLFTNSGTVQQEVQVLLPIPPDAVVTDGVLLADGREYPAEVMDAAEARRIYEDIVRRRRDPALIELVGHGLIRLSAFPIPPGGSRTVTYRYHQSVATQEDAVRLHFPFATLRGLGQDGPIDFRLDVTGQEPIVAVYSPSHSVDIDRKSAHAARVTYEARSARQDDALELIVRRSERPIGVDLRTAPGSDEDDYFLLAVSPGWDLLQRRHRTPETAIFVLDTSGSMDGEKFIQARTALHRFIDDLDESDRFNVVAFSDGAHSLFEDGPHVATRRERSEAREWIDRLDTGGSTAIGEALDTACQAAWEPTMILFLTDGRPTVGEKRHDALVRRARRAGERVRFFAFGVGYDVDARLLDDLAQHGGGGAARYVRSGENVDAAVTELHRRVAHPCARRVRVTIDGAMTHDVFPRAGDRDLYAGEPLLLAGRVRPDARHAVVRLTAESPSGEPLSGEWRVDFDDPHARSASVPVLWAARKAASLLDDLRRSGRDPRTVRELRALAARYGILTEEVALLARDEDAVALSRPIVRSGRAHVPPSVGVPAPVAPQDVPSFTRGGRANEVTFHIDAAAEASRLRESKAAGAVTDDRAAQSTRVAGGVTFEVHDGVWVDQRLAHSLRPAGRTTKIRAYGASYFTLVARSPKLVEWFHVGEHVRILLPGLILEVAPDGADALTEQQLDDILAAVKKS